MCKETISDIEIRLKYLKPPTHEQIFGFIEELGVHTAQFERYYKMPTGILRQVKGGHKPLPVKYWPIFYQRIVPQYGIGYQQELKFKKNVTKNVTKPLYTNTESHDRLISVK